MGLVLDEKLRRNIENNKRVVFNLFIYSDDFADENEEGSYTCGIKIFDENNKLIDEYVRLFKVSDFSRKHYMRFVDEFCNNIDYRESFNIKNEQTEIRDNDEIDEEIRDLIKELNELGLTTVYSCQGTKDKWSDRPCKSDGHSIDAYIIFSNGLPRDFLDILQKNNILYVCHNEVRTLNRKNNKMFPQIMKEAINEYKQLAKNK